MWRINNRDMVKFIYQGETILIDGDELSTVDALHLYLEGKFERLFADDLDNLNNVCQKKLN